MPRSEFIRRMNRAKKLVLGRDMHKGFSCNAMRDAFRLVPPARDHYKFIFSSNHRDSLAMSHIDIEFGCYGYDMEQLRTVRLFALNAFEQICLEEKLYKEF